MSQKDDAVLLCTGGYDRIIRFWEAPTAICTRQVQMGDCQVNCMQISPDKKLLACGGNPNTKIFSTDPRNKDALQTLEGHSSNIISLGFQKNQKWLYTCSEDGTLKIWDLRTYSCQRNIQVHKNKKIMLTCAILHPNQGEIIIGDQSGFISLWDLQENKIREKWKPEGKSIPIRSLSIASDASLLCVATHRGVVYSYKPTEDVEQEEEDKEKKNKNNNNKLGNKKPLSSPKLRKEDSKMEQNTGAFTLHEKWVAHDNAYCLTCRLSPDCKYLATASSDSTVVLWSIEEGYKKVKVLKGHTKWVWDIAFSFDSQYLVTASSDKTAKLWDINSGQSIVDYVNHMKAVTCVALNDAS